MLKTWRALSNNWFIHKLFVKLILRFLVFALYVISEISSNKPRATKDNTSYFLKTLQILTLKVFDHFIEYRIEKLLKALFTLATTVLARFSYLFFNFSDMNLLLGCNNENVSDSIFHNDS